MLWPVPGIAGKAAPDTTFQFTTAETCRSADFRVEEGVRYLVQIDVQETWSDGTEPTDPRGLSAIDLGPAGLLGVPFRRAVTAGYLQPVAHIRGNGWSGPSIQPLELEQRGTSPTLWRGEFVAAIR